MVEKINKTFTVSLSSWAWLHSYLTIDILWFYKGLSKKVKQLLNVQVISVLDNICIENIYSIWISYVEFDQRVVIQ